jgi:hypothetical protein
MGECESKGVGEVKENEGLNSEKSQSHRPARSTISSAAIGFKDGNIRSEFSGFVFLKWISGCLLSFPTGVPVKVIKPIKVNSLFNLSVDHRNKRPFVLRDREAATLPSQR